MRSAPLVIHICGWPGSGKQTIGRALAAKIGGRLIDNHLMISPASAVYNRGQPGHLKLRQQVQIGVFDHALDLPADVPIIFTNALAETPEDRALFAPFAEFARQRDARMMAVTLEISGSENEARLTDPKRIGRGKLMDISILRSHRVKLALLRPEGAIDLTVDGLTAEEAADQIVGFFQREVSHG